ncbi:MAG: hypothetical protein ACXW4L_01890 [Candidatus Limnocylindrales bacterium]
MVAAQPTNAQAGDPPGRPTVNDPFALATAALDAARIRWVRLRPRGEGLEDDLLVEDGAWSAIERALASAGFVAVRRLGRGSHRAFHAFDAATGGWWKLDLVSRIDLGRHQERPTTLAEPFLAGRRPSPDGPGWLLAPVDAFWALLLHDLFDRDRPEIRHAETLRSLAAQIDPDALVAADARAILPAGTAPAEVIRCALAVDTGALERLGSRMRRAARSPGTVARALRSKVARRIDRFDPPFVRPGLAVALLGPDGAGKSTLVTTFASGAPLPVRSVYLGLYGGTVGGRRRLPIPGLGLAGRLVRMWRGWLVGRWHMARGRLVLFDRHPLEARMPPPDGRRPGLGRRIVGRSLPVPELVIVLDAPAATLFARKPEHPVERLEAMRAGYLALARRLRQATVVDVRGEPGDVARAVTALGWGRLAKRSQRRGRR